jgi:hypothetical protein
LTAILEKIGSLAQDIVDKLPKPKIDEKQEDDPSLPGLLNLLWLILLALIMLFLACLKMLLHLMNVPATTDGMNETFVQAIDFMKNVNIYGFNMSFHSLVTSVVFGVQIFAVIKVIRKYVHKEFGR